MKPIKILKSPAVIYLCLIFAVSSLNGQQPRDYVVHLTTSTTENPATISFKWEPMSGTPKIYIWRKPMNIINWGFKIATLPADTNGYTDNNVETGVEYEYRILKNADARPIVTYVNAGIKCKEIEYRGKVILLIDSTFIDSVRNEINLFETDLIGDGWDILRKDISRSSSVKYVKSIIRDFYNSDTVNVKAVILLGHIPVPYSGCEAYDGHIPDHYGAWSADIYYGDINEKIWTDVSANCTGALRSENWNVPGDGKFDVTYFPSDETISLQVGRIDFYNLPAFPQSESELLKNYLRKDHNFRHKTNDPKLQALVCDNFGWYDGWGLAIGGWRSFTALFNSSNVKAGGFFYDMKKDSYIWSYACGPGEYISCAGVGNTTDFVNQSPLTVFTCLWGSKFGDWDSQDNFMRAALASKGWILTCMWSAVPFYTLHQMGMGETIGYCLHTTQNYINNYDKNYTERNVVESMQGDPTLRMHVVCPVNSLQSAITANNSVILAWKPADDNVIGYFVYKLDTFTKKYNKITTSPVTDTWFEDTVPVAGNNYYMVKTFKLSQVVSGSYYNLSQGIFDTLSHMQQTPVSVTGIDLSLDAGNIKSLKIYDPFKVDATILPANATNKLLKWSVENITGNGKFDKNGDVFPEKGGVFAVIAEALDGSGIKGRLEVTVDSVPDAAGAITGEESVCRGNVRRTYTVPEIRGASAYIWNLPNGVTDTTAVNEIITVFDNSATSGYISAKGHNPYADGNESTLYITLNEIPPTPMIVLKDNILHSNTTVGNQWYMGSNMMIPGATDSIYIPEQEGRYYVIVTLNDCPSKASNAIQYPPTFIDATELTNETVIYPNPTTGQLEISLGTDPVRQATIKVFSLQGNLIYSEILQNVTKAVIDLTAFPKGMYLINVITIENNYVGKVCLK
jgi:hypothetical protein